MEVTLNINGDRYQFAAAPDEVLLDTLRKLGLKSVKRGCETGSCGVCQVFVNGQLVPSCAYLTIRADHLRIVTLEGLQEEARNLGKWIIAEGVEQCGYCSPGHMMAILAMLKENPHPSPEEIKHYLAGNLCRCSGYEGQHRALSKMLEVTHENS